MVYMPKITMAEQGLAAGCAANVASFSLHAAVMSNAQDRKNTGTKTPIDDLGAKN
jgi:hypothetical protein